MSEQGDLIYKILQAFDAADGTIDHTIKTDEESLQKALMKFMSDPANKGAGFFPALVQSYLSNDFDGKDAKWKDDASLKKALENFKTSVTATGDEEAPQMIALRKALTPTLNQR